MSMLYAFELSGEHEKLPAAEVLACLKTEGLSYQVRFQIDQCLGVEFAGKEEEVERALKGRVVERLAMTHHILKVIGTSKNTFEEVLELAKSFEPSAFIQKGQSFSVRVKKIKHYTSNSLSGEFLEQKIGGCIYRKGFRAKLKTPDREFRLLLGEEAVFGVLVSSVDRSKYEARTPQKKPFFHPGVLMPRIARTLVNISGIKEGEFFLDPFCGTGGILVEAELVGAQVCGLDAQKKMVFGARMNLKAFEINSKSNYLLLEGDACKIPLKEACVDSIVTDPPYGRSAAVLAASLEILYSRALLEFFRVLKPGGIAVVVSDRAVLEYGKKAGFKVLETYVQRVHRSLTRTITVFQKPC